MTSMRLRARAARRSLLGALTAALSVAGLMGQGMAARDAHASAVATGCTGTGAPAGAAAAVDPFSLYGDQLRFRVLRNGAPIGHHEVRFRAREDEVIAETRFEAEVRILFLTAYRYHYHSRDVWRDGCLVALTAETNDNGKRTRVEAEFDGEVLRITSPAGAKAVAPGIHPTTHWNAGVLDSTRVLNTITGRIAEVDLIALGEDRVVVEGRTIIAQRYRYAGDIESEVWYDAEGRWVKMRFNAKDGSTIEYVCERCGAGSGSA